MPGADAASSDIDLIVSLSTTAAGGADQINTGHGNDIVIGGRFGDTINARDGDNLVVGDSGRVTAARIDDVQQFAGHPMTIERIETIEDTDGGADTILTLTGYDVVLSGHDADTVTVSDMSNLADTGPNRSTIITL